METSNKSGKRMKKPAELRLRQFAKLVFTPVFFGEFFSILRIASLLRKRTNFLAQFRVVFPEKRAEMEDTAIFIPFL